MRTMDSKELDNGRGSKGVKETKDNVLELSLFSSSLHTTTPNPSLLSIFYQLFSLTMPREKVDYRAARAVLSAPYPLPVIITRSRAAASAPPPSSIPLTEVPVEDDHHSIIEIIPDPPPTPTTGGLAAQHGFPYNSKWKSIPPAFPPIPYPPKAEGSGGKNILKLKKKHQGDKDEAEAMSGIEEGTSGENDTLHEISGMGEVAMPAVPVSSLSCAIRRG